MPGLKDFLPMPPWEGPPVPRFLGNNNPIRFDYKELNSTLDRLTEEKRREWLARYPDRPGLVEKALSWAEGWTSGLIRSELYTSLSPELKEKLFTELYKIALIKAERWIEAFAHS